MKNQGGEREAEEMRKMIHLLIEWLEAHGMTAEEIADFISYITQ